MVSEVLGSHFPHVSKLDFNFSDLCLMAGCVQIYVTNLSGRTITLQVDISDTVMKVKEKIKCREGVPPDQQHLVYGGQCLEDARALTDYGIQEESTVFLLLSDLLRRIALRGN